MLFRCLLVLSSLSLWCRETTFPYLSEDVWYFFADWKLSPKESFDPTQVQLGDVVLIEDVECALWKTLAVFEKEYLPKIPHPFVLLTPRTDYCLPGPFAHLLENKKIAVWFVQNIDRPATEKLQPIPIGQASKTWRDPALLGQVAPKEKRDFFIYANFANTCSDREICWGACAKIKSAVLFPKPIAYEPYVEHLARSLFVASPPGNGPDCHRTWEALLMGCYPIVKDSYLNPLFEELPVVIVKDWSELTKELLDQKKKEFEARTWSTEKLYAPYWFSKIRGIQANIRNVRVEKAGPAAEIGPSSDECVSSGKQ